MKTFKAILIASALVFGIASVADAKSRVSSRPFSSPSRNYSAPKMYAAPKAAAPSKPTMKSLGFGKPASTQTVSRPAVSVSPSKTITTSGGWFSRKNVSSTPAPVYKAPARKVSSPVSYRSQPQRNVTVIQRNYYGGNSYNGYNRGYGSGNYGYGGGYYGRSGGGMGDAFIGTMGGMMVYNALFNNHSSSHSSGATAAQIEQAKQDQRIEDKLDRVLDQQQPQSVGVMPVAQAPAVVAQPQCFLPEDAPLMMSPSFYCQPQNNR